MPAKKILIVAGARPNFMKVAPLVQELRKFPEMFQTQLIHTGQHYDPQMSEIFFRELELPQPDRFLGVGSGTHAEQTARVLVAFEQVCLQERPDLVIVVGDVNSTIACALAAKKLCIPIAHVEAGLRSRDWTMPEEINRVLTDAVSDLLFTTSPDADENLVREGISAQRIHRVGNIMVDCLLAHLPKSDHSNVLARFDLAPGNYATLTLHRQGNVDDPEVFGRIIQAMSVLSQTLKIVWPIHPRSRKMLMNSGLSHLQESQGLIVTDPLGYLDMQALNRRAKLILTDSGGLQGEAAVLGVPCITLRDNTEWLVTVHAGANQVVGTQPATILAAVYSVLNGNGHKVRVPELWDGCTASRIVRTLRETDIWHSLQPQFQA